ncbi:MAG TPA: 30S ribosomal protein S27ae [Candidatus Bathyarchaeota archaeon]|nr:30S ribosomal protein S27ae [Candidatus Bathyarchaeota archaeon]
MPKESGVWHLYEVNVNKMELKFKGKKCPRCGKFMAFHPTPVKRWMCGGCKYVEYVE